MPKTIQPVHLLGPGPFLFPLCGKKASAMTGWKDHFVLQLETAEQYQSLHIPISRDALLALKTVIDGLASQQRDENKKLN